MTREEAIKELKEDIELYIPLHGTIDDVDRDLPDGRLITALEMAIKALEQEPLEVEATELQKAYHKGFEDCRKAVLDIVDSYSESQSNVEDVTQDIISYVVALPPVNPQPYEDAISREDALMALTGEWTEITDEIIHRFIKRIKALPPVNPQSKTGHWEWVQYDYNPKIGNWHCSECRSVVVECVSKEEKGGIPLYKYCPQCGAKMSEIPTGSDDELYSDCIDAFKEYALGRKEQ